MEVNRNDLLLGFWLGMLYVGVVVLLALCLEQKRSIRALRGELYHERLERQRGDTPKPLHKAPQAGAAAVPAPIPVPETLPLHHEA